LIAGLITGAETVREKPANERHLAVFA